MGISRHWTMLATTAILGAMVSVAFAQPAAEAPKEDQQGEVQGRGDRRGAFGGRFGGGRAGGGDQEGMREMMRQRFREGGGAPWMRGGPGGPGGRGSQLAVVATEKYLFIVRGNQVIQLDVDTLEILNQKELPQPEPQLVGENKDLDRRSRRPRAKGETAAPRDGGKKAQ